MYVSSKPLQPRKKHPYETAPTLHVPVPDRRMKCWVGVAIVVALRDSLARNVQAAIEHTTHSVHCRRNRKREATL